jgi:flagellar biosynthesis protein FlhG
MDPASYLDAYNFIKVGLLRRLSRIFGPESPYRHEKDDLLKDLIGTFLAEAGNGRRVADLSAEMATTHPQGLALLNRVIAAYRPRAIINMPSGKDEVDALAERLCKVSKRMLSVDVAYIGQLGYDDTIHRSTQNLVPHVTRYPEGTLAQFCRLLMADIEAPTAAATAAATAPVALTA